MKSIPKPWRNILAGILMIGIAALAYLTFAYWYGYYYDDWYLIYAGLSQGTAKFSDIFASDRPFRAYHVAAMFKLFGVNPWYYSLSAFLLRCAGAFGLLWILRLIWPGQRQATFLAALLFLVYPGFRDQPNAIDYQSHQLSFALAIFSIGLTVKAILAQKTWVKVALLIGSAILQLIYLLLMEYYIGLEGLRLLLIAYLIWKTSSGTTLKRIWQGFLYWLPALVVSIGFLFWRTFLFQDTRAATDVNSMFAEVGSNPAMRFLWMGVALIKDLLSVLINAWTEPIYHDAFNQRLKLILLELGIASAAGGLTWLALKLVGSSQEDSGESHIGSKDARDMALIGVSSAILALIPVHLGSRHVDFDNFSRFTLTPSIGVVMILAAVYIVITSSRLKNWFAVALVSLAVLAHVSNGLIHMQNWLTVRDFWWQASWRIPQLEPGTVIMASYPDVSINEDYFVWGPANLIYYPKPDPKNPDMLMLNGATLSSRDLKAATTQSSDTVNRRSLLSERDFANLLVMSKPSQFSCVQVLDGLQLELSEDTRPEIALAAPFSRPERILLAGEAKIPPKAIFGEEPEHGWCYFYEKASLARQNGDWQTVIQLAEQADQAGLRPYDRIEWLPFLEAYAWQGDLKKARNLALILKANPYYQDQICHLIEQDASGMGQGAPQGYAFLQGQFCKK